MARNRLSGKDFEITFRAKTVIVTAPRATGTQSIWTRIPLGAMRANIANVQQIIFGERFPVVLRTKEDRERYKLLREQVIGKKRRGPKKR